MDPFRVLGVAPSATDAEIRAAYLTRSKELHPDRYAHATEAEQALVTRAMQELNAAYDELRNRATYTYVAPEPRYVPPPRPRRVRWFVIAIVAVVLGVGIVASSGDNAQTPPLPGPNFAQLQGKCVTFDKVGLPDDVVDCTRPHDARVMRVVDHGTPCPIWTNEQIAGTPVDLCLDTHQ